MSEVRISYAGAVHMCVAYAGVKPGTAKQWIARGHFQRFDDGFDPDEIEHWIATIRNEGKARGAALSSHTRYQTRRTA